MILIRLIKFWARMLEWLGNTFAALGMRFSERASNLKSKVIEKLQIRKEKIKRGGKTVTYRLLVSHDAGMTYHIGMENTNLKQLIAFGKDLDDQMLRWYIIAEGGRYIEIACKIHDSILSAVENDNTHQKVMMRIAKDDMEKAERNIEKPE